VSPTLPVEPEVAKNGNIFNIWTLDMKTGELRQYTDTVGGNVCPIVLQGEKAKQIAFVTYFKGEWGVHTLDRKDPLQTALLSDFGEPGQGPPVDFQAGGNIYGGTAITFSDVLGDKEFNFYFASISQYRTIAGSYVNLSRRLQYAIQGFSQTDFFYGQLGNVFYDPSLSGFIDRDLAIATRTAQGGSVYAIYPFNRYRRIEMQAGVVNFNEEFEDPSLEQYSKDYQTQVYGAPLFNNGTAVPFSVAYVQETTVFREFGPLSGNTLRFEYEVAPKIGNTLERQTLDLDARYYLRLGGSGLLALRARGYRSWGDAPNFNYFGGNADLRGYDYLQFVGNNTFYGNAELRFPLVEAMLTPIGVVGGIRGVFFAGTSGAWFNGQGFQFASSKSETVVPITGYQPDPITGNLVPVFGNPIDVTGYRLVDGRASYGFGLETFALGFPIHFDWAWRTLWNRDWEDYVFAAAGGSHEFRRPQFKVWIGYDF
jgi:hypothetical protein